MTDEAREAWHVETQAWYRSMASSLGVVSTDTKQQASVRRDTSPQTPTDPALRAPIPSPPKPSIAKAIATDTARTARRVSASPPMVQLKLEVSEPEDPLEQEADEVAERATRTADVSAAAGDPPDESPRGGAIVQRKCAACGKAAGTNSGCRQCSAQSRTPALTTPLAVHAETEADRLGARIAREMPASVPLEGELDASTRRAAERHLAVSLVGTRWVGQATTPTTRDGEAALAVAEASTIRFDRRLLDPSSAQGRLVIGHELAHVGQQRFHGISVPQPWKIDKGAGTAVAEREGDTLGKLAVAVGATPLSWKCIVPVSMKTAEMDPPPDDFDENYELYVQPGDEFNISHLLPEPAGGQLHVFLFSETAESNAAAMAKKLYPAAKSVPDVDDAIRKASGEGQTPIGDFVVIGHAGGSQMFGQACLFQPSGLSPEEPVETFERAHAGKLPRRCWLTASSTNRAVGCNSVAFGNGFASAYLRKGATINVTLRAVQPWCTDKFRTPATDPDFPCGKPEATIDAIRFRTSDPDPAAGPFTDRAGFEGATDFWAAVQGLL